MYELLKWGRCKNGYWFIDYVDVYRRSYNWETFRDEESMMAWADKHGLVLCKDLQIA